MQRFEDTLERDACLLARGSHVCLAAAEEAEHGLVGWHENRADKVDVPSAPAKLGCGPADTLSRCNKTFFAHTGPVAFDKEALRAVAAEHGREVTAASPNRNRVFPYVCAAPLPVTACRAPCGD